MFEAKIDLGMLVECIEAITAVVDDGVVNITKDGWDIRVVDPANVAMVSLELPIGIFDSFEFEPPEGEARLKIGVDFANLLGMFRLWEPGIVELELNEKAENLFIRSGIFDYTVSVSDPSEMRKVPNIPKLHFPMQQVCIEPKKFIKTVSAMKRAVDDDFAQIGVKENEIYMEGKSEHGILRAVLGLGAGDDGKNIHSQHSIDYLTVMCRGMTPAEKKLTLFLGNDYPIQIDFEVADGKGKVSYLLAPRIEY